MIVTVLILLFLAAFLNGVFWDRYSKYFTPNDGVYWPGNFAWNVGHAIVIVSLFVVLALVKGIKFPKKVLLVVLALFVGLIFMRRKYWDKQ
jgi:hypothetical protein